VYAAQQQFITAGSTGSLSNTTGSHSLVVVIPSGATDSDAYFQLKALDKTAVLNVTGVPTDTLSAGLILFDLRALTAINVLLSSFNQSLTITMNYSDSTVADIDESTLHIYRWDGTTWEVLSGCTVDTVANNVTCSTTQFSVFGLFGTSLPVTPQASTASTSNTTSSSGSSSSSSGNSAGCSEVKPTGIVDLFEIKTSATQAKIFFTPLLSTDSYYVSFAPDSSAEAHGAAVTLSSSGIQSYSIFYLKPATTYYMKVRGQQGCMPGEWSEIMQFTTQPATSRTQKHFYKYGLQPSSIVPALVRKVKQLSQTTPQSISTPPPGDSPYETPNTTHQTTKPAPETKKKFCFFWWCF